MLYFTINSAYFTTICSFIHSLKKKVPFSDEDLVIALLSSNAVHQNTVPVMEWIYDPHPPILLCLPLGFIDEVNKLTYNRYNYIIK